LIRNISCGVFWLTLAVMAGVQIVVANHFY
jgi:hypothetical protein